MAKKTKTVNPKDVQKSTLKDLIINALAEHGEISNGIDYGFTKDTIVLHADVCDVQIKLITPKTGILRYEIEEE